LFCKINEFFRLPSVSEVSYLFWIYTNRSVLLLGSTFDADALPSIAMRR